MEIIFNGPNAHYVPSFMAFNYDHLFRIITITLVVVLAAVLYATLLRKKNEDSQGFKKVIYDFLKFNTYCISYVLQFAFVVVFLYNTIFGCLKLFVAPWVGLKYIIVYNLIARLIFEFIMIIINKPCKCKNGCDCNCDCGCDCNCDCEYEDIDLDEELDDENATTIVVEDITDEYLEDMRIQEEEKKECECKKQSKKKTTKEK